MKVQKACLALYHAISGSKSKVHSQLGKIWYELGYQQDDGTNPCLLLVSPDALSAEEVMEQLEISRGNANMNLRELIDWGLVQKVIVPGERKEFFSAEKDIWKVARQIIKERKKRELDLMLPVLKELSEVEGDKRDKAVKTFTDTIQNIRKFSEQADKTLDVMVKADEHWFLGSLVKMFSGK